MTERHVAGSGRYPTRLALTLALALALALPLASIAQVAPPGEAPNEPEDQRQLQRETLVTIRNIGTAWMSWLTDELGAAAAGKSVTVYDWPYASPESLEAVLVPTYIQELPRTDAWGHPLEFRATFSELEGDFLFLVRSPGSDGLFDGDSYEPGPFEPDESQSDIVWADGYFLRWPERTAEN